MVSGAVVGAVNVGNDDPGADAAPLVEVDRADVDVDVVDVVVDRDVRANAPPPISSPSASTPTPNAARRPADRRLDGGPGTVPVAVAPGAGVPHCGQNAIGGLNREPQVAHVCSAGVAADVRVSRGPAATPGAAYSTSAPVAVAGVVGLEMRGRSHTTQTGLVAALRVSQWRQTQASEASATMTPIVERKGACLQRRTQRERCHHGIALATAEKRDVGEGREVEVVPGRVPPDDDETTIVPDPRTDVPSVVPVWSERLRTGGEFVVSELFFAQLKSNEASMKTPVRSIGRARLIRPPSPRTMHTAVPSAPGHSGGPLHRRGESTTRARRRVLQAIVTTTSSRPRSPCR